MNAWTAPFSSKVLVKFIFGPPNLTNISGNPFKGQSETLNCSPANASNQLNTCYSYDAAGNTTVNGSLTYTYDAENRLISAGGMSYIYDGDGKRVEKCTAGSTAGTCASGATGTMYWMGWRNEAASETDLSGNVIENYIFFGGQRIARRDASPVAVHFYFSDHLGTHSLVTDANGDMPPQEESDFYPYGGEIPITTGDSNHYKFTSKERDAESLLDNFGARFYASSFGRFMTPDWAARPISVPYAKFGDPQTLNLYAYVENGPLNRVDADGHADDFRNGQGDGSGCPGGPGASCPSANETTAAANNNQQTNTNVQQANAAQNQTLKGVPADCQGCSSEKKAAIAAEKDAVGQTRAAAKKDKYQEYGGWIITKDGKTFTYTKPVTFGEDSHFYPENVKIPKGYAEVASYHTHPDPGPWGEGFSPGDMAWANRNQMNIYVGMSYSGNVRQFVPGVTKDNGLNGVSGDLIYTIP